MFSAPVSSQVDEDVALDQAVKFCQIQLAASAQRQVDAFHSHAFSGGADASLLLLLTFTRGHRRPDLSWPQRVLHFLCLGCSSV